MFPKIFCEVLCAEIGKILKELCKGKELEAVFEHSVGIRAFKPISKSPVSGDIYFLGIDKRQKF